MAQTIVNPSSPQERDLIIAQQNQTVSANWRKALVKVLTEKLGAFLNGRGLVTYEAGDPTVSPAIASRFLVKTDAGRTIIILQASEAEALASQWRLTKSRVPLAPQTLARFGALTEQTNFIARDLGLQRLDPLHNESVELIRAMIKEYHPNYNFKGIDYWVYTVLEGSSGCFAIWDTSEVTTSNTNIFVTIARLLEDLAQPKELVDSVLEKLQRATEALSTAAAHSPIWKEARINLHNANEAVMRETAKLAGEDLRAKQLQLSAQRRCDQAAGAVLPYLQQAVRLYCEARTLAESQPDLSSQV